MFEIRDVQDQLQKSHLDGWLLYDFQGLNPIARRLLGIQGNLLTRRWYFWIPKQGEPTLLCHQIEKGGFASLNAQMQTFKSWQQMLDGLRQMLRGSQTIAMEFSPFCSIPYVSRVDAGTVQAIESFGKRVVSSADLVQYFQSRWNREQFAMHQEASGHLMNILFATFREIGDAVRQRRALSEYEVQSGILDKFQRQHLITSSPPIIAANQNSGNPHYEPSADASNDIHAGDFLLVDLWAKLDRRDSVYADYTWIAFLGDSVPQKIQEVWEVVKRARDAAVEFVRKNYPVKSIQGWEVDKVARNFIAESGFGDNFIHRTGHNIGEDDHGTGANMDSLETKDERSLVANTCFSIEPGVYLPEFGVRSEVNVFLEETSIVVTGDPVQNEIFRIACEGDG
jgi:Xaa-Pro dipeptidase